MLVSQNYVNVWNYVEGYFQLVKVEDYWVRNGNSSFSLQCDDIIQSAVSKVLYQVVAQKSTKKVYPSLPKPILK